MGLKDLLFRDEKPKRPAESTPSAENIRPGPNPNPGMPQRQTPVASPFPPPEAFAPVTADVSNLAQKLVEDFKRVVEKNNYPGVDMLEFSRALFKKSSNPAADDYRQIFDILRAVEESLTTQRLIESSSGYKKIVFDLAAQEMAKGTARKTQVEGAKAAERKSLDAERQTLNDEVARLEAEIQRKKERAAQITSSLNGVDKKYQPELEEIAMKISAIEKASQEVIGSFDDIEHGIRSYLQ